MPEYSDNLPLYYQVVMDLLNKIKGGELPTNAMLTPEEELAREYGVSRNTIRHAIGLLVKDGYLMRIPGKGTFVLNPSEGLIRDQWAISSIEDMLQDTKQTKVTFEPMMILDKPPNSILQDLQLQKWNKVCLFQGIKYRKRQPVSFLQVYLPYEIGVQVDQEVRGQKTVWLYMEESLGINITQVDQYMTIGLWSAEDAHRLECQPSDPKVMIKRIFFHGNQPVELSLNHYHHQRFSFFYRVFRKNI
ncbi:MAG: GntR family transcriptional regulator [Thermodesulfobacteriota bacterium]